MATVQYGGGVTAFRGSVVGNTFQRNAAGEIIRSKRIAPKPSTPAMALIQSQTFALITAWRTTALPYQYLWNQFAAAHTKVNLWGQEKTLSGFNWFIAINSNRYLAGEQPLTQPPTYSLPDALDSYELVPIANVLGANFSVIGTIPATLLVIYTTPPTQSSAPSLRSMLRQTLLQEITNSDDLDITQYWQETHGIPFPPSNPCSFSIGSFAYTVNPNTGLASPPIFSTAQWSPA
jgi:hypothetical protein